MRTVFLVQKNSFLSSSGEELKHQNHVRLVGMREYVHFDETRNIFECGRKSFGRIWLSIVTLLTKIYKIKAFILRRMSV